MELKRIYATTIMADISFELRELKDILVVYNSIKSKLKAEDIEKEAVFVKLQEIVSFIEEGDRANA